ncbi:MAG: UDP binding domain-containing protein, partial [Candidatus Margulisiibacteriota bacterium]
KITKTILYSEPEPAELAKLFCNMYRYIDFAIGNEFMMIAEDYGCDIYEVLNLVNNGYKRSGLKSPGFTAGPCLVKDGFFLIDKSPYMELVMAAWRLNENIPGYLFKRVKAEIPDLNGKKVAMLGLAFKKNIDDSRFSLVPKFVKYFASQGAKVMVTDPLMYSEPLDESLKDADILVIGTNHDAYKSLTLAEISKTVSKNCLVCDVWNMFGTGKIVFYIKEILPKTAKKA